MSYQVETKEDLEGFVCHNWNEITEYLDELTNSAPTPIYTSVDIRESKTKFSPVDNNIYPAGFNNVCALDLDYSIDFFKAYIEKTNSNTNCPSGVALP